MKQIIRLILVSIFVFNYASKASATYKKPTHSLKDSTSWAYVLGFKSKAISYTNGLYSGYVFFGLKHGYGTLKYSNGDIYKGYWLFNKKNGLGKLTYSNGDYYDGRWKADKMNGYGVYYTNNKKYAGIWADNSLAAMENDTTLNTSQEEKKIKEEELEPAFEDSKTNEVVLVSEKKAEKTKSFVPQKVHTEKKIKEISGLPPVFTFGKRNVTYDTGEQYTGKLFFGRRSKMGKMVYSNGNVYQGNWHNDQPKGVGVLKTPNGDMYKGTWEGLNGYGKVIFNNGMTYSGDWDSLRLKGPATVRYANGTIFQGTYRNNIRDGYGTIKYADSTVFSFEGNWVKGKRKGVGTMKYADGRVFKGEFLNDVRHGHGVIYNTNGNIEVEAEWENGKRKTNPIEVRYFNGDVYLGLLDKYESELVFSKRSGYGNMTWADAGIYMCYRGRQRYLGDWHNNMRHGKGTHYYSPKVKYVGQWKNDMRHGEGVLYFENGEPLKGQWKNDCYVGKMPFNARGNKMNGYGIKVSHDGSIYEGFWHKGKRSGYGMKIEDNRKVYEGNWYSNSPEGRGVLYSNNYATEVVRKRGRDVKFRRDSTYFSLSWALIEAEKVSALKLSKGDSESENFTLISRLKNLKQLSITISKPLSTYDYLFELKNLESLSIKFSGSAYEDTLTSKVFRLTKLKELKLEGHSFVYISPQITALKDLEVVNLIGLNSDKIPPLKLPEEFWKLKKLKKIYLDGNKISHIPELIGEMKALEVLSIKENLITKIPNSIGMLPNLQSLNVFHNRLRSLPNSFGNLTKLSHLDASHNSISVIPQSFCNLADEYKHTYDLRMNPVSSTAKRMLGEKFKKATVKY